MTNPLTPLAKNLRKSQTEAERALWRHMRSRGLSGLKFRRQQPIGTYIVDFVCLEKMVIIEVDGGQHANSEEDRRRDAWLEGEGYVVLRFWNNEVLGNLDGVMEEIWRRCVAPSPQPPPLNKGGEGKGRQPLIPLLLVLLVFLPSAAFAHVQQGQAAGLLNGLRHPVSGLDHVLAMVAVGLWGAQLGTPAIWLLPVTFPLVMACGGFLGLVGVPLPGVEVGVAASAVLLGSLVAAEARPPLWLCAAAVAFFAVFHGHAHGTELPAGQSGLLYSVGFVIATGCLHATGIAIGLIHRWAWGRAALRVAGAAVAAGGVFFLWRALS